MMLRCGRIIQWPFVMSAILLADISNAPRMPSRGILVGFIRKLWQVGCSD
jgi:hypothetical protein